MNRASQIKTIIVAALLVLLIFVVRMAVPTGASTREVQLQARAAVFEAEMKRAMAEAAHLRQKAARMSASIQQLEEQIQQNKTNTDETLRMYSHLPADSLGRHVSEATVELDRPWY